MNNYTQKKRVLHIIASMADGGAQRVVYDFVKRHSELKEYDLYFLSLSGAKKSTYDLSIKKNNMEFKYLNIPTYDKSSNFFCKVIGIFRDMLSIYEYVKSLQLDIIHTHMSGIIRNMIFEFMCFDGKKYHTMHSDPYSCSKLQVFFCKLAFHCLNVHPIAVGEMQRRKAIERYGLSDCDLLRNSVDIKSIQESVRELDKTALRKKYNLPENAVLIGSVGRLHPVKNFDGLLKIFVEYKKKNKNSCLVIAGEGQEKQHLLSLASSLGVAESVFLIGNIPLNEIYAFYKALDIFVMTSRTEAAPMVFLEAQAVGVRCVVANSIDKDMVFMSNVICMPPDASINDWCNAFENRDYINSNVRDSREFDLNTVMARLEVIYNKY